MDIWEANANAASYTPHVCTVHGQTRCSGDDCGDGDNKYGGVCDKDGCDFNSYRMGDTSFFGVGKEVNTSSKFTVVTQFITADGTSTAALTEIRRVYVQDGRVIQNSKVNIPKIKAYDSITDAYCHDEKKVFDVPNAFKARGGLEGVGKALDRGMVLVMSLWDDYGAHMLWLDSDYPVNKSTSIPGVARGPCTTSSGVPSDVQSQSPDSSVTFSNIKFGDIGSTYSKSC
jgi:cellulose 1,4-beta-cellobiosidase